MWRRQRNVDWGHLLGGRDKKEVGPIENCSGNVPATEAIRETAGGPGFVGGEEGAGLEGKGQRSQQTDDPTAAEGERACVCVWPASSRSSRRADQGSRGAVLVLQVRQKRVGGCSLSVLSFEGHCRSSFVRGGRRAVETQESPANELCLSAAMVKRKGRNLSLCNGALLRLDGGGGRAAGWWTGGERNGRCGFWEQGTDTVLKD